MGSCKRKFLVRLLPFAVNVMLNLSNDTTPKYLKPLTLSTSLSRNEAEKLFIFHSLTLYGLMRSPFVHVLRRLERVSTLRRLSV